MPNHPKTMRVCDSEESFYIINESDFNPEIHTEYGKQSEAKAPRKNSKAWYIQELIKVDSEFSEDDLNEFSTAGLKELYESAN